jgi:hypothetical protein
MAAQQMVEKAFLPVRLGNPELKQSFSEYVAQGLDPTGQANPVRRKGRKQMHVIRHYDIATNGDIVLLRLGRKDAKCVVNFVSCQQALTLVSVECDKVKRPNFIK